MAIAPHDPSWAARFESIRVELLVALGSVARRIDHVGSTAVPGLPAKPVIDVQVSVADVDREEPRYRPPLERLGLALRYREADWAYFRTRVLPRTHHVHVVTAGGRGEREQLLFVAFLREHHERRDAYAALKYELAERFRRDRMGYTEAKAPFIKAALALAEEWAAATRWSP